MRSHPPRITVVIPCYNDGRTILEAVRSTSHQDGCDVVIVNDGSEDAHTIQQLRKLQESGYPIITQDNRGAGGAITTGALAAATPYVFPLAADDILVDGSLTRLADHLDQRPELALVWGDFIMFGDFHKYGLSAPSLDPWEISYINDVPGLVLIRREVLISVGAWELRNAPDWDLAMTLAEHGCLGERLPIAVFRYRRHGQRTGNDTIDRYTDVTRLLRSRHPDLFTGRPGHARRSRVPRAARFAVRVADRVPGLSDKRKAQLIGGIIHGHRRFVLAPQVASVAREVGVRSPTIGSRFAEIAHDTLARLLGSRT